MTDDYHRWADAIARDLADVENFGIDWPRVRKFLALVWGWRP